MPERPYEKNCEEDRETVAKLKLAETILEVGGKWEGCSRRTPKNPRNLPCTANVTHMQAAAILILSRCLSAGTPTTNPLLRIPTYLGRAFSPPNLRASTHKAKDFQGYPDS